MKSILLTGAFGFIGSHMSKHLLSCYPEYERHRPGQDWRYSVDCSKLKSLGWQPQKSLDGMKEIIKEIK